MPRGVGRTPQKPLLQQYLTAFSLWLLLQDSPSLMFAGVLAS